MPEHASPSRAFDPAVPQQLRTTGSNHVGMRQFNERVVLQAIRLHGPTPKAELARLTHLSTQTVGIIIGRLLDDGLVRKLEPQRGRVGQPSVPIALDPDGAYSLGIKVGRRSLDVLLVDFLGHTRLRTTLRYRFPHPEQLFGEVERRLGELQRHLGPDGFKRLAGVGIAAPLSLGGWQRLLNARGEDVERWRPIDIQARVQAMTELPVELIKDTSAACVAELVAGHGRTLRSFLYLFVGTFIGGGLVLDSHLHPGRHGNAGAIASLPLQVRHGSDPPRQLLSCASLLQLEAAYEDAGLAVEALEDGRALHSPWLSHTRAWVRQAADGIALAIVNAASLLDQEGVILDGNLGRPLLDTLVAAVDEALDGYDWEGIHRPRLLKGQVGADARALGGALLPLYANFAPDRDLFLKPEV